MRYEFLKGMADIISMTKKFSEVLNSVSSRLLFKKFSSTFPGGPKLANGDDGLCSDILNEGLEKEVLERKWDEPWKVHESPVSFVSIIRFFEQHREVRRYTYFPGPVDWNHFRVSKT